MGAVGLEGGWIDGDSVYWLQGLPSEGGRSSVWRLDPDGTRKTFEDINVEALSKGQKDLKDALIILPDDIINVKTRIF